MLLSMLLSMLLCSSFDGSHNRLTSLNGLGQLRKLQCLRLSHNLIRSLEGVDQLVTTPVAVLVIQLLCLWELPACPCVCVSAARLTVESLSVNVRDSMSMAQEMLREFCIGKNKLHTVSAAQLKPLQKLEV